MRPPPSLMGLENVLPAAAQDLATDSKRCLPKGKVLATDSSEQFQQPLKNWYTQAQWKR